MNEITELKNRINFLENNITYLVTKNNEKDHIIKSKLDKNHIIISRLNDIKEYINNKQYILAKLAANDLIQEMEQ